MNWIVILSFFVLESLTLVKRGQVYVEYLIILELPRTHRIRIPSEATTRFYFVTLNSTSILHGPISSQPVNFSTGGGGG